MIQEILIQKQSVNLLLKSLFCAGCLQKDKKYVKIWRKKAVNSAFYFRMVDYFKFPKIPHLPWSESDSSDIRLESTSAFNGKTVVVTEKMDGENWGLYRDKAHARSIDSCDHESRHWIKSFHAMISYNLPDNIRLCVECLYAKHSILYSDLPSYALLFGVFENDLYLSWDEVMRYGRELNIPIVSMLYYGAWDEEKIKQCFTSISTCEGDQEGYVVRNVESFKLDEFTSNIAKFVRKNHVQTGAEHWFQKKIVKNKIGKRR